MSAAALAAIFGISSSLGYLLPAIIGLESMGIPSPGETALVLAAVLASQDKLDIKLVILIGVASAIIGDNVGYLLGRLFGRDAILKPGPLHAHRRRAVAYGWRQEKVAESARAVSDLGRELHGRLGTMVGHFMKLGRQLESSVKAYNDTAGSLEGRVLVTARRFSEHGAAAGEKDLPEPPQIETAPRTLQPVDDASDEQFEVRRLAG